MHTVFTVCFEKCSPVSGFLFITNKTTTAGHQIVIFTCYFCISNYFETNLDLRSASSYYSWPRQYLDRTAKLESYLRRRRWQRLPRNHVRPVRGHVYERRHDHRHLLHVRFLHPFV